MKKYLLIIGIITYVCIATSVRKEQSTLLTVFKNKPRSEVLNGSSISYWCCSLPRGIFYTLNFYVLQHHVQIEAIGNNSTNQFRSNPTKTDISQQINDFFQIQSAGAYHEELMEIYQLAISCEEYQRMTDRSKSDLLFTLNQVILFIHKLEKINNHE